MQVNAATDDDGVPLKAMSDMPAAAAAGAAGATVVMDPNNPMCLEGIVSLLVQFGYVSPTQKATRACLTLCLLQLYSRSRLGPGGLRHNRKLHRLRFIHVLDTDSNDMEVSCDPCLHACALTLARVAG